MTETSKVQENIIERVGSLLFLCTMIKDDDLRTRMVDDIQSINKEVRKL